MPRISKINPENASPEVRAAIDTHLSEGYRLTNECCPYVNTNAPPQKARKMGVSWDMCFAHPSSQMAKILHIGEL